MANKESYQQALAAAKQRLDENLAEAAADVVVLAERFDKTIHAVAKDVTEDCPELFDSIKGRSARLQKARSEDGSSRPIGRSPNEQAGDTRRFLTNPTIDADKKAEIVAEVVMSDPDLEAAITRAQTERALERRSESAKKKAADPVGQKFDERVALHELQAETAKYTKKARTLIPEIGIIPDSESFWLKGEAEDLEDIAAELRHMAEHKQTRSETELQNIVEAG